MVEEGSWIEPTELLRLVERDVRISGDESPAEAIMREPHVLIALSSPSVRPLDLPTYRIRRDRWQAGEGPRLNSIQRSIDNAEPYSVSVQLRSQCQPGRSCSHDQDVKVQWSIILHCNWTSLPLLIAVQSDDDVLQARIEQRETGKHRDPGLHHQVLRLV